MDFSGIVKINKYIISVFAIVLRPFAFIAPKIINYLAFQSFDFDRTCWTFLQKHTKFDTFLLEGCRCHDSAYI